MSALSSMCRTLTLLVALAALCVASAHAASASSAKSHRKASASSRTHRPATRPVARRSGSSSARRAPATRAPATRVSAARTGRPSPQEVGRAAGLRIRSQMKMSRRTVYRRRVVPSARYRRPRLVETASITRYRSAPAATDPVATDLDQRQPAMPARSEQSYAENSEAATEDQTRSASQPATDGGANVAVNDQPSAMPPAMARPKAAPLGNIRSQSTQPARNAIGDAAVESSADTADEPPVESTQEVASLAIPRGAMPAPLKGSLASLERQNDLLAAEGLERIENEDDLAARIANHLLVPLPVSDALTVNPNLPENHRYCRPWTARFVADLAREHDAIFHRPLEISSAVRTVEYQRRLMRINGNAAPAEGDVVSPHLTGATIDIAKEGLTRDEMKWMRHRLLEIENQGKIDVEEEFQQACFHITVYKTYAPPRTRKRSVHPQPEETQPAAPEEAAGPATEGL